MLIGIVVAACSSSSSDTTPAATYTISGNVTGAASVLVTLSGASTATATTDASGNYSFAGLANGSYAVTPSKSGYIFNPISTAVSVSGTNVTATNFAATASTAATYAVSGTVSGAASSGVTITLGGSATGSVVTGAGGTYSFPSLVAGNYTLTPSLTGYAFSPTSIAITALAAASTGNNFVATAVAVPHSISGNVSGTTGVTITVTGFASPTPVLTDGSGNYTVTGLYDGSYTVTPSKTGYTFTPTSTAVTMSGANVSATNFAGVANTAVTATVFGTVSGAWLDGVTITMSGGATGTTTTNATGNYSFPGLASGASYTFTPSLAGYTYLPASPSVSIPGGSSTAVTVANIVVSSAIASNSLSGTISYTGAKTGTTFIRIQDAACTSSCYDYALTSMPNAPSAGGVSYKLRGGMVTGNSYVVKAFIDVRDTGAGNSANPGFTSAAFTALSGVNTLNIAIADQTTIPAPVTPTGLLVAPGDSSAFVQYTPPVDVKGREIATSYKIYYGTTSATIDGSATFSAQGKNNTLYFLKGLTNTASLYFKISALNTNISGVAVESALSAAFGPVTIGVTTGLNTVSGTVTTPAGVTLSATTPMIVGLYSSTTGVYFTGFATPSNSQSYSISGVPNGSYYPFAIIDMNNNGRIDSGDISNTNGSGSVITVGGNVTGNNITLSSANATAIVNTEHQSDGVNNYYTLILGVDGTKRAVSVTLVSGLNMPVPFDLGALAGNEQWTWLNTTSPIVGDSYKFKVTYWDNTSEYISGSVNGVISNFAQSLAATASLTPTFSWTAPATPPASYAYRLHLYGNGITWDYPSNDPLPSTTLSAVYNGPALTTGLSYTWQVTVRDGNGNRATRLSTFTAP